MWYFIRKNNMKFDSKINFKSVTTIDIKNFVKAVSRIWKKIHISLFFAVLIIFIVTGGYIWKQNVYSGEWSAEKKQEYLNTQNKEVIFIIKVREQVRKRLAFFKKRFYCSCLYHFLLLSLYGIIKGM